MDLSVADLLSGEDIYLHDDMDYRQQKAIQFDKIFKINEFVTTTLEQLLENPNAKIDTVFLKHASQMCMNTFITEYMSFSQFESITIGGDEVSVGETVQDSIALQLFDVTARVQYLSQHCEIVVERELADGDDEEFLTLWKPSMMQETLFWMNRDTATSRLWQVPVMQFTASQIQDILVFLTESIDRSPFSALEDFRKIESLLWIRIGELLSFNSSAAEMDVPDFRVEALAAQEIYVPSRTFRAFCSIYMNVLRRRLFYFDLVRKGSLYVNDDPDFRFPIAFHNQIELPQFAVDQCRTWVHHAVCDSIGDDGFSHLYGQATEQTYIFPGDAEWFKYRYPARPQTTGIVLDVVRRHLTESYYAEFHVSKQPILCASERDDHPGLVSRLFLFYAIDQYMSSQYNIHWMDGVVIENTALESSVNKLSWNKYPCLLHLFNRYWVYDSKTVYPSDNLYETLTLWFFFLRERHEGKLFGANLNSLCNKILNRRREVVENGQRIVMTI